jgi:hypothetical protein
MATQHNDTIFTPEQQMSHFNREGDELHNGSLVPVSLDRALSLSRCDAMSIDLPARRAVLHVHP